MIKDLIGKQLLFFDGAMGTELQKAGLKYGEIPDLWNLTHPDIIKNIHSQYLAAGSDFIKTNTFGCNTGDLQDVKEFSVEQIVEAAVANAKEAIKDYINIKPRFIALDIGPTGKLIKPLGDLYFEDAVSIFSKTVKAGANAGADLILIETISDAYELKAAVLAAKESCNLPIIASVTLDSKGKLMTGGNVDLVVTLLEGLGVNAIGLNCGFGIEQLSKYLLNLLEISSLPVLFMPNAGLPEVVNGITKYNADPKDYAKGMRQMAHNGTWLLGGCCGTTPAYIEELVKNCKDAKVPPVKQKYFTVASSYGKTVYFGERTVIVGERINPTGKPKLRQAIKDENYEYALREGITQTEQGADVLDVNVGIPGIDESSVLTKLVEQLQAVTDTPLQIDTADLNAMERAMRIYNGKPLINSVNGKESSMSAVFPLLKKYGGIAVALTLDENGIPETAQGRIDIAKKILEKAKQYGIGKEAFLFDPLTMAISAGQENALVTLECVKRLKQELSVKTILGVSNVSFGLPCREILNSAFLYLALEAGLNASIINPAIINKNFNAESAKNAEDAELHREGKNFGTKTSVLLRELCVKNKNNEIAINALLAKDEQFAKYIEVYGAEKTDDKSKSEVKSSDGDISLNEAILKGLKRQAAECAKQKLTQIAPLELIESELIPALNTAGERFESGNIYLPQLLMCAEAAKSAFSVIRNVMGDSEGKKNGTIVLATVEGDIHDIGKNIVRAMLESYRFYVIDLGKDVPAREIVEAVKKHNAKLAGLSALMTTTVASMEKTIIAIREAGLDCKILCGGAVLTEDYAKQIGADSYAKDAMASVRYAQKVFGRTNENID